MGGSRRIGVVALISTVAILTAALSAHRAPSPESVLEAIHRNDNATLSRLLASGANANVKDSDGIPAVMLSTLFGDAASVELLLKHGADPNAADAVGATALMWAVPDLQKARVLIERGANVNARSTTLGRTPLLIAAAYPGTVELLDYLLARGADLRAKDSAGYSALATAMRTADVEVVRFLVAKGLEPKEPVPIAATTAAYVRPRPALLDYLMAQGMKAPKEILPRAANWQGADLIKRFIADGADTNARGGPYNQSALLAAAASEWASAETLQTLLAHGADPNVSDSEGERPLDWAIYRNDKAKIAVLEKYGATRGDGPRRQPVAPPGAEQPNHPRIAVERSVSLLLKSAPPIFEQCRCFSCHHNTVPAEVAALARRKGLVVPEQLAQKNVDDILAVLRQAAMPAMQAQSTVPGNVGMTVGYGLMALAAENYQPDKVTASLTHWLLATQMPDGSWVGNGVNRPPIEYSTISHTVIALRGLTLYAPPGRTRAVEDAVTKARGWLLSAKTAAAEERAMRLLGLLWTKAPAAAIKSAADEIVARRGASGGWSQLDELDPDAYATGLSLYALHEAGMAPAEDVYRKGVEFLLKTQYPDGSWFVRTRAFPVQPYFESGFPFGRHQWIAAAGTAWAARAIALSLPDASRTGRE